jgi:trk system potassium uptake protein TrkH
LTVTEKASYLQVLFETVSALGNTGLSAGITPSLGGIGKMTLIITMFIGRVGPLTLGFALAGRRKPLPYQYAREDIFVG